MDDYWEHKKALSAASVVKVLVCEEVVLAVRRELNRNAPARLDVEDVFNAIRDVLSKEAILEAGDLSMKKRRKKRRRSSKPEDSVEPENDDQPEPNADKLPEPPENC